MSVVVVVTAYPIPEHRAEAVEGVSWVILASCDVQYHVGEREGEDELSD